jgi:intermediate filament protein if
MHDVHHKSYVAILRLNDANKAVADSREKIDRQNQQLSDYEAEINLLRRRLETLESDRDKDKKQIATLQDALNRVRMVRVTLFLN